MSSATIPNSDIGFRRDGSGERALVFVHGFLDDQYVWDSVIADLSAPGFEVVRLDLAGFGDRTEAAGPFTYERFASDLAAVVDALDKPFVLVGHSMAAPIVELVAAARPERALGVVVLAPIPMAGAGMPDEALEMFRTLGEVAPEHFRGFRQQAAPFAADAELDRLTTVATKLHPEVVRAVADLWNNGNPGGRRPSWFFGPLLVIRGGDDELITAEVIASAVAARFSRTQTTVNAIDKSGHWPHLDQPSAVAAEISAFLAGLSS